MPSPSRAKLEMLRDGTLDDKRANSETSTKRFAALANFLEAIPVICLHDLFTIKDVKARASQAKPAFADTSRTMKYGPGSVLKPFTSGKST